MSGLRERAMVIAIAFGACLGTVGVTSAEAGGARPIIAKRPAGVSGQGVAVVRIACPRGGTVCRGQVVLRPAVGRARPALGAAGFALRPGSARRLGVRLNARGVKALARRRTLRVEILVATRAPGRPVRVTGLLVLRRPAPPRPPRDLAGPPATTNDRTAALTFAPVRGVSYECSLDGRPFVRCPTGMRLSDLPDGDHVVSVRARHRLGVGAAVSHAWHVGIAPVAPAFSSAPVGALSASSPMSFTFASSTPGVSFVCSLDGAPFVPCTSPVTHRDLRPGAHTLSVMARDASGRSSDPATTSWTVAPLLPPFVTGGPAGATTSSTARISFSHANRSDVSFLCSLDGGPEAACQSPAEYRSLGPGAHTFSVRASGAAVGESAAATHLWTVASLLPDVVGGIEDIQIKRNFGLAQRGLFFSTNVINLGAGPLEIRTTTTSCQSVEGEGRIAAQRVYYDANGDGIFSRPDDEHTFTSGEIGCIVYHPAHRHLHFQDFGVYQLFKYRNGRRGELVSQSDKISYCMIDELPHDRRLVSAPQEPFYPYARVCRTYESLMGISVGWNDQYAHWRPDQFVPIDDVPNGTYCLQVRTDYRNRLAETDDGNNDASVKVEILDDDQVRVEAPVTNNLLRC